MTVYPPGLYPDLIDGPTRWKLMRFLRKKYGPHVRIALIWRGVA